MKKESLLLGRLLKKIAPSIGAKVFLEPEWNVAGQITFKNGRNSFFRYNTVDLNPIGSSEIAKDKDYANLFMKRMGYRIVPRSKTFFSDDWAGALNAKGRTIHSGYRYARTLGFPVIVKPNSGSQGNGVSLVHNKQEFYKSMRTIFLGDRVALVQKFVEGTDYRIVVLDRAVISAYQRIPLNVVGNGALTILGLLRAKQKQFRSLRRDTQIRLDDPRIKIKLKHQKMTLRSVPKKGERVYVLDNANLSGGGDAIDVTQTIHPSFKKIAIQLTKNMGLRLCGVDLITRGDIRQKAAAYWILEINAAPGLDHYSKTGGEQRKIVEEMYLKVLKSIEKHTG